MSESMLAAAALKSIGTSKALEAYQSIFQSFSDIEREDLVRNLERNVLCL